MLLLLGGCFESFTVPGGAPIPDAAAPSRDGSAESGAPGPCIVTVRASIQCEVRNAADNCEALGECYCEGTTATPEAFEGCLFGVNVARALVTFADICSGEVSIAEAIEGALDAGGTTPETQELGSADFTPGCAAIPARIR